MKTYLVQYWEGDINDNLKNIILNNFSRSNGRLTIYNQNTARNFIKENYELDVLHAFDKLRHPAIRSDLFRTAYLLKKGGCFTVTHLILQTNLEDIIKDYNKILLFVGKNGKIWNGFLYGKEGASLFRKVLEEQISNINSYTTNNIESLTGSSLLDKVVNYKEFHKNSGITIRNNFEFQLDQKSIEDQGNLHWSIYIKNNDIIKASSNIPKNIIQYFNGDISPDIEDNINCTKYNNEGFYYKLYNYEDACSFIKNNFSQKIYLAFKNIENPSMQSDIFRLCAIYIYGGYYFDISIKAIKNLQNLCLTHEVNFVRKWHGYLMNGFIAAEKYNDIIGDLLQLAVNNLIYQGTSGIMDISGPVLYRNYIEKQNKTYRIGVIGWNTFKSTLDLRLDMKYRKSYSWLGLSDNSFFKYPRVYRKTKLKCPRDEFGKDAICIVAHPDDCIIFGYSYIIRHSEYIWKILYITHERNSERFIEMQNYWRTFGVSTETLGLEDNSRDLKNKICSWNVESVKNSILEKITGCDLILTHGHNGEYGHPHHLAVHNIIKDINHKNTIYFVTPGYKNISGYSKINISEPRTNLDMIPIHYKAVNQYINRFNLDEISSYYSEIKEERLQNEFNSNFSYEKDKKIKPKSFWKMPNSIINLFSRSQLEKPPTGQLEKSQLEEVFSPSERREEGGFALKTPLFWEFKGKMPSFEEIRSRNVSGKTYAQQSPGVLQEAQLDNDFDYSEKDKVNKLKYHRTKLLSTLIFYSRSTATIEVGAFDGSLTNSLSKMNDISESICIEPNIVAFNKMKENLPDKILMHNCAISDSYGVFDFFICESFRNHEMPLPNNLGSLLKIKENASTKCYAIETKPLNHFISERFKYVLLIESRTNIKNILNGVGEKFKFVNIIMIKRDISGLWLPQEDYSKIDDILSDYGFTLVTSSQHRKFVICMIYIRNHLAFDESIMESIDSFKDDQIMIRVLQN